MVFGLYSESCYVMNVFVRVVGVQVEDTWYAGCRPHDMCFRVLCESANAVIQGITIRANPAQSIGFVRLQDYVLCHPDFVLIIPHLEAHHESYCNRYHRYVPRPIEGFRR